MAPPRSIIASVRSKRSVPNQRSSSGRATERPIAKQSSPGEQPADHHQGQRGEEAVDESRRCVDDLGRVEDEGVDQREGEDQQRPRDPEAIELAAHLGGIAVESGDHRVVQRRHGEDQAGEQRDPGQGGRSGKERRLRLLHALSIAGRRSRRRPRRLLPSRRLPVPALVEHQAPRSRGGFGGAEVGEVEGEDRQLVALGDRHQACIGEAEVEVGVAIVELDGATEQSG